MPRLWLALRGVACLACLTALTACGPDTEVVDSGAMDSGVTDGEMEGSLAITPPGIPWLDRGAPPNMLAPCPEGWREITGELVTECDPYPDGGAHTCEAGEAHFPGEAECRPIGDPCPDGDYAAALPTDRTILYVKAGAPTGGDGSLGAPYGSLSEVNWVSAGADTTIALAKGTYRGTLPLRPGARVVGACVRDTILTGVDSPVPAVITAASRGEAPTVRNLSVVGAPQFGAFVILGRSLNLDGVLIDRATSGGIVGAGAGSSLSLTNVVVQATRPETGTGIRGHGISIQEGAHLEAARFIVASNHTNGVAAHGAGSEMTLTDGVIRGTQPRPRDRREGGGLEVTTGAHVEGSRLLVEANHTKGVFCTGDATTLALIDCIIRNTQPEAATAWYGRGVTVQEGAHFDGSRLLIASNHEGGVTVAQVSATATLTDVVIRDTKPRERDLGGGRGIVVQDQGQLEATRLVVANNRDIGIFVAHEGSNVSLTDALIQDTQPEASDDTGGRGINVQFGGHLGGTRLVVLRSRSSGLFASSPATSLTLFDVVVQDTLPGSATEGTSRGIYVQDSAALEGTRLRVDGVAGLGLATANGASAILSHLTVANIRRTPCETDTCIPLGYALGAAAAELNVTSFDVRRADTCGVFLAPYPGITGNTSVDLSSGIVAESEIGACVQVDDYDYGRLTHNVAYLDNRTNLQATMLPVPPLLPNSVM